MARMWLVMLLLWTIVMGGCDGAASNGEPSPSPTAAVSGRCPNEATVASDRALRLADPQRADVDGDRADDAIALVMDESAVMGCEAFLVVDTGATIHSVPVWETGAAGGLPTPRINSVVQINAQPGAEIVVDEVAGAATQFVGVFTLTETGFARLSPVGRAPDTRSSTLDKGLFAYGGSVGHVEAVDCIAAGRIAVTIANPAERRRGFAYSVTRLVFEVAGAELLFEERDQAIVTPGDLGNEFPEYETSPFGSCSE